jgi:lactoylglutathione lyase
MPRRVLLTLVLAGAVLAPASGVGLVAQPASARARITGIDHVAFRVTEAAAARTFYGETLGLRERAGAGGARLFAVGAHQHLRVTADLPSGGEERLDHLAFATPDAEALAAQLRARGIAVASEVCDGPVLRVRDPDGHTIEFVARGWPPADAGGTTAVPTALSTRVLHAGLTVRDEAAATRFYGDVLGFSEIWRGGRTEGTTDWVNMRVPHGTDYLEYMLIGAPPDRRQRGVLHHVCLLVPDIQAAWEEVGRRTAAGRRAGLAGPNVGRNGRWQLNLYDAEGTRTELMEPFRVR